MILSDLESQVVVRRIFSRSTSEFRYNITYARTVWPRTTKFCTLTSAGSGVFLRGQPQPTVLKKKRQDLCPQHFGDRYSYGLTGATKFVMV